MDHTHKDMHTKEENEEWEEVMEEVEEKEEVVEKVEEEVIMK